MIDIHPPHHGAMTRRDIFTHLAIVVAGILIAVGLEQTVELVHRRYQRSELEDRLHQEAQINHDSALIDMAVEDNIIAWLLQLQHGIDTVRESGGKASFPYPQRPDGTIDGWVAAYRTIAAGAWTSATNNSLVDLLPKDAAEMHARVYRAADLVAFTREQVRQAGLQQGAFETRFSHGTYPPVIEIAHLSPAQLDQYESILADELEVIRFARGRLSDFAAQNDYVLSGGLSSEGLHQTLSKADASH